MDACLRTINRGPMIAILKYSFSFTGTLLAGRADTIVPKSMANLCQIKKTFIMRSLKSFTSLLLIYAIFSSCNSSMRVMATWVNKEKVQALPKVKHTIFIFVMTQNFEAKTALENDLANAAQAKGLKVYKSLDVFGPLLTKESLPYKDAMLKTIRDLGCDAIFTVAVVDQQSETRYVPGSETINAFTPYAGYGYSYSGYYAYSVGYYTPGYYTTDKTYFIESNLFDAKTEELLVAMQSKVVNPPEIQKASKQYTAILVQELQNQGFLKGSAK
jgi:hypothetical protein